MTGPQKVFKRVHHSIRAAIREELDNDGAVIFSTWRRRVVDAAKRQGISTVIASAAYDCIIDRIKARLMARKQTLPAGVDIRDCTWEKSAA